MFLGAVRLSREIGQALPAGGSLALVLSSSVRAPLADMAISNGLRPGLAMVAKTLAEELGPHGVRVNGLMPAWLRCTSRPLMLTTRSAFLGSNDCSIVDQARSRCAASAS